MGVHLKPGGSSTNQFTRISHFPMNFASNSRSPTLIHVYFVENKSQITLSTNDKFGICKNFRAIILCRKSQQPQNHSREFSAFILFSLENCHVGISSSFSRSL